MLKWLLLVLKKGGDLTNSIQFFLKFHYYYYSLTGSDMYFLFHIYIYATYKSMSFLIFVWSLAWNVIFPLLYTVAFLEECLIILYNTKLIFRTFIVARVSPGLGFSQCVPPISPCYIVRKKEALHSTFPRMCNLFALIALSTGDAGMGLEDNGCGNTIVLFIYNFFVFLSCLWEGFVFLLWREPLVFRNTFFLLWYMGGFQCGPF